MGVEPCTVAVQAGVLVQRWKNPTAHVVVVIVQLPAKSAVALWFRWLPSVTLPVPLVALPTLTLLAVVNTPVPLIDAATTL